ncbi:EscU/YscU/HrcU family type III secretion system export apparatus switch protein [Ferrimicrobium acidiphilum]|uniref:EscU/YscU/HrcU family type III secretion system export apparatus switch protein n=1 Tax=Ferrimicrobium acidiphilum TaxID=121039 RepID=UPI0023F2CEAC|nr:EscU/YscU/HrcU family type III secretion system export apparatus switch protein [Ferrimicrobium acidiphilum]
MPKNEGTEQATAHKLEKARKEGTVARSAELATWLVILAFSLAAPLVFHTVESKIVAFGHLALGGGAALSSTTALRRLESGLETVGELALLVAAPVAVFVVLINVAQVGIRFVPKKLRLDFTHFSPRKNLSRIFSTSPAVEAAKSLVKLLIVVLVSALLLLGGIASLTSASISPIAVASQVASMSIELVRLTGVLGLAIALIDFARSRTQVRKQLMMTRQEVKDETKQYEGDMQTKGRRRRMARELSRRRMIANVALADVVVANPMHVAVALKYEPTTQRAPIVLAKGSEYIAVTIRERARVAGVPIVIDPPLARALNIAVPVGEPIPGSLFLVVARLLAFVYQLSTTARYYDSSHQSNLEEIPEEILEQVLSELAT